MLITLAGAEITYGGLDIEYGPVPSLSQVRLASVFKVPVVPGTDNVTTFQAVDDTGAPYPLAGVTRIDVALCSERAALSEGVQRISSQDDPSPISFSGSTVSVRFGALNPYQGKYYPIIIAYDAANPDGVVLAGRGFPAEVQLVCSY